MTAQRAVTESRVNLWLEMVLGQMFKGLHDEGVPELADRTGFCWAVRSDDGAGYTLSLGNPHPEKVLRYTRFAGEKCARTCESGQISSFTTRDPANDKWGGGIKVYGGYAAISGLPEVWDEALIVAAALALDLLSVDEANAIFDLSQNPHRERVFQMVESYRRGD